MGEINLSQRLFQSGLEDLHKMCTTSSVSTHLERVDLVPTQDECVRCQQILSATGKRMLEEYGCVVIQLAVDKDGIYLMA